MFMARLLATANPIAPQRHPCKTASPRLALDGPAEGDIDHENRFEDFVGMRALRELEKEGFFK